MKNKILDKLKDKNSIRSLIRSGLALANYDLIIEPSEIEAIKSFFALYYEEIPELRSLVESILEEEIVNVLENNIDFDEALLEIKNIYKENGQFLVHKYFEEIILSSSGDSLDIRLLLNDVVGYEVIFSNQNFLRAMVRAGLAIANIDEHIDNSEIKAIINFFARNSRTEWIEELVSKTIDDEMSLLLEEGIDLQESLFDIRGLYEGNELIFSEFFESVVMSSVDCEFDVNQELLSSIMDIIEEGR